MIKWWWVIPTESTYINTCISSSKEISSAGRLFSSEVDADGDADGDANGDAKTAGPWSKYLLSVGKKTNSNELIKV